MTRAVADLFFTDYNGNIIQKTSSKIASLKVHNVHVVIWVIQEVYEQLNEQ